MLQPLGKPGVVEDECFSQNVSVAIILTLQVHIKNILYTYFHIRIRIQSYFKALTLSHKQFTMGHILALIPRISPLLTSSLSFMVTRYLTLCQTPSQNGIQSQEEIVPFPKDIQQNPLQNFWLKLNYALITKPIMGKKKGVTVFH